MVVTVDAQPAAGALLALGMEADQLGSVQSAAGDMARRRFTRRSMAHSASSRQRSFPLLADDLLAGSHQRDFSQRHDGRARQPCPCRQNQSACSPPGAALWRQNEAVKP